MLCNHSESDNVLRSFLNLRLKILLDICVLLRTTEVDPEQSRHTIGFAGLYFAMVFSGSWSEGKMGHEEFENGGKFIPCEKYENKRSQV